MAVPLPIVPAVVRGSAPHLLPLARGLGAALIALWLGLSLYAVATFRRAGTTPNPIRSTTALALAGPYRFTRNPMYFSLTFLQSGIGLLADALWPLAALIPAIVILRRGVDRPRGATAGDATRGPIPL